MLALQAIMNGDQRKTRIFLLATLALGATFLGVQVYEYIHLITVEGFTPSGSLFGAGFYTVTGFHGFHVFIGLMLVSVVDTPGVPGSILGAQLHADRDLRPVLALRRHRLDPAVHDHLPDLRRTR